MRKQILSGAVLATLSVLLCIPAAAAPRVEEELPGGKQQEPTGAAPQTEGTKGTPSQIAAIAAAMKTAATLVVEGEALRVKASRGETSVRDMSAAGDGWSGGQQLYWAAPGEGAMLTVAPEVPAGRYEVTLFLTQGPDYARIEALGAGGVIPKSDVELYSPELAPPAQVSLGILELGPERGFALRVTGHDPRASGFAVGIDRLQLLRAGEQASTPARVDTPSSGSAR